MDDEIKKTLTALRKRHINAFFAADVATARQKTVSLVPEGAVVGLGDSTTARQMDITQALREKGARVLNPFEVTSNEDRERLHHDATLCDVFLAGTNALTRDGRLVNVDAVGNRVAGMFWGHPLSIVIVGKNKIVRDLDEAFTRIRQVIAPTHFRIRTVEMGGKARNTPCVATGECGDCRATDRGCNVFTIIEGKPIYTDLNVIIVDQDLGLGWDPAWPAERIAQIREHYKKFVWVRRP